MEYSRRNTTFEGAMWFYNEMNVCDTAIMLGRGMANNFKVDKITGTRHCLIVKGRERDTETVMVLPTTWQPTRELQDAIAAIHEELNRILGQETESYVIMAGGDPNTTLWTRSHNEGIWQDNMEDRAQAVWEWIHTWGLKCKPPQSAQKGEDIWSYTSPEGHKKRMGYVLFNRDFDDAGGVSEWNSRSDHRPVCDPISPCARKHHARMGTHAGGR